MLYSTRFSLSVVLRLYLNPTPYTPHPTPYTLHPTPYTLHPTPYTLHPTPTPYTLHLHLTPYTLHPTPYTLHPKYGVITCGLAQVIATSGGGGDPFM